MNLQMQYLLAHFYYPLIVSYICDLNFLQDETYFAGNILFFASYYGS